MDDGVVQVQFRPHLGGCPAGPRGWSDLQGVHDDPSPMFVIGVAISREGKPKTAPDQASMRTNSSTDSGVKCSLAGRQNLRGRRLGSGQARWQESGLHLAARDPPLSQRNSTPRFALNRKPGGAGAFVGCVLERTQPGGGAALLLHLPRIREEGGRTAIEQREIPAWSSIG